MPSITIRNIPDSVMDKIRRLSVLEHRSLNGEMVTVLEKGLKTEERSLAGKEHISREVQVRHWKLLAGKWKDPRSGRKIAREIAADRTAGRETDL